MPTTTGPSGTGPAPQRCCLGLLIDSQARQDAGQSPLCLGLPHTPAERVNLAAVGKQPGTTAAQADFKFMCLGHALYEQKQLPGSGGRQQPSHHHHQQQQQQQQQRRLPYCEGLELVLGASASSALAAASLARPPAAAAAAAGTSGRVASDAAAARAGTGSSSGGGGGAAAANGGASAVDDIGALLAALMGGDESPVVRGAARFNRIATRNWDRMRATANQAYAATLKPLVDRLSGDPSS